MDGGHPATCGGPFLFSKQMQRAIFRVAACRCAPYPALLYVTFRLLRKYLFGLNSIRQAAVLWTNETCCEHRIQKASAPHVVFSSRTAVSRHSVCPAAGRQKQLRVSASEACVLPSFHVPRAGCYPFGEVPMPRCLIFCRRTPERSPETSGLRFCILVRSRHIL